MIEEYCTGCGLCQAIGIAKMRKNNKGFLYAQKITDNFTDTLMEICPSMGSQCKDLDAEQIFGKFKNVYLGYSLDKDIRYKASSGGVLTAISIYLLENKIVDGIIQICKDSNNPIETIVKCSTTSKEVLDCCGSRYTSSAPLINILEYLDNGKKYAFIGKPCDITALRNYSKMNPKVSETFPIMLSFFCAGTPSTLANEKMLEKMNIEVANCKELNYRGNGWPGYATAVDNNGNKSQISYQEAWRDTLGRDVRLSCRFCLDGIGELADIACGDAWYIENNKPIFNEGDGRNVIFSRTEIGEKILKEAFDSNKIYIEKYENYLDELQYSQAYQVERRKTMKSIIFGMKLMGRKTPKYDKKVLKKYSQNTPLKLKVRRCLGIMKRVHNGKI